MAKDNEYPYKHKHIAMKYGHATFTGGDEPSEELLKLLDKIAELAYEQCERLQVDTGENNALLPDVSACNYSDWIESYCADKNGTCRRKDIESCNRCDIKGMDNSYLR